MQLIASLRPEPLTNSEPWLACTKGCSPPPSRSRSPLPPPRVGHGPVGGVKVEAASDSRRPRHGGGELGPLQGAGRLSGRQLDLDDVHRPRGSAEQARCIVSDQLPEKWRCSSRGGPVIGAELKGTPACGTARTPSTASRWPGGMPLASSWDKGAAPSSPHATQGASFAASQQGCAIAVEEGVSGAQHSCRTGCRQAPPHRRHPNAGALACERP